MKTIHTVTLNPVIDLIYRVGSFEKGTTFRCNEFSRIPAGKGLNVSYALSSLDVNSHTHVLLGSDDMPVYKQECDRRSITLHSVCDQFTVRRHCTILETQENKITHIQTRGETIENSLADQLTDNLSKMLTNEDIVILSGSVPPGIDENIYGKMINRFKCEGVTVILDSSGEPLRQGLNAHPYLIKFNQHEAEEIAQKEITSPQDEFAVLHRIHHSFKIPFIVVSFGAKGMLAGCDEGVWRLTVDIDQTKIVDTVGCGDTMIAGMVYAMKQGLSAEEMFRQGIVCATASALKSGPGNLDKQDVANLQNSVHSRYTGSL